MKGIILAGGTGSRLYPLTKVTNKHLLPIGRYPMIYHPVAKLAEAGIKDILIVTGTEHIGDIVGVLGGGSPLGLNFTYRVQEEAGGIAQALSLAEDFTHGERFVVILGDNIFESSIQPSVERFAEQPGGARLLLKEVPDPERYGVAEVVAGKIHTIVEKPRRPQSRLAVTGIYMYDGLAFDIIRTLRPSARGELEITDVNRAYLSSGYLEHDVLDGWWTDAGTRDSFLLANRFASSVRLDRFERPESGG